MTNYIQKGPYLIVGVPEGGRWRIVHNGGLVNLDEPNPYDSTIDLPPGQYSIIGEMKDVSEEVAKNLVDKTDAEFGVCEYRDYTARSQHPNSGRYNNLTTALEALHSLIRSQGWGNCIILKIENHE